MLFRCLDPSPFNEVVSSILKTVCDYLVDPFRWWSYVKGVFGLFDAVVHR